MATRARRARKPLISNAIKLQFLAVSAVAAFVIQGVQELGAPQAVADGLALVLAAVAVLAVMVWWSGRWRRRLSRSLDQHADQLVGVYLRSRRPDAFGGEDRSAWDKQVALFLRRMVFPGVSDAKFRQMRSSREFAHLASRVTGYSQRAAEARRKSDPSAHADAAQLSSAEYEDHCASSLKRNGWSTQATPRTRDSGADVIATKGAWRVAVESKRYSRPVGNKAVQQVNAARTLYAANAACVVAPHGFTRQAEREACGLGVLLLHHSDLPRLAELLGSRADLVLLH